MLASLLRWLDLNVLVVDTTFAQDEFPEVSGCVDGEVDRFPR
jgi:hypothetical protein